MQLGRDPAGQQKGDRAADHHPDRAGEEHDQRLGPQAEHRRQVGRDGQQHQGGGQQEARGDEIEPRLLGIDDAEGGQQRGQEIAEQQGRDDGEEPLHPGVRQAGGPEDGAENGGQQAEDDGVIGDEGRGGFGFRRHGVSLWFSRIRAADRPTGKGGESFED
jgi:hypothetical protein